MEPVESAQLNVDVDRIPSIAESLPQLVEAVDDESRVRLWRRVKVRGDPQMNFDAGRPEPTTASGLQISGLVDLRKAQHAAVEIPRNILLPCGYRQLHMMETDNQFIPTELKFAVSRLDAEPIRDAA